MGGEEYVQITQPKRLVDARRELEQWLETHCLRPEQIDAFLRQDVIRSSEGTVVRYMIRKELADRLGTAQPT